MTVKYEDLTPEVLIDMTMGEKVVDIPKEHTGNIEMTKLQIVTLLMIDDGPEEFDNMRNYEARGLDDGTYIPSENIVKALDEVNAASYTQLRTVKVKKKNTFSVYEKRKKGGDVLSNIEAVELIAETLGLERKDLMLTELARMILQDYDG